MAAYGSLCTEFYDLDKPSAPADALAFYVERARKARGRILEPMCGSGRFLVPMSLAGLPVDGVDSSSAMLAACRTRARSAGIEVSIFLQELASLKLPQRYSMAFIPSGSIGLICEDDELQRALSCLHTHLEPGGILLLELVCDDGQLVSPAELKPRAVLCPDGTSITYTCIASRAKAASTICYSGIYTKRRGAHIVETETEELTLRLCDSQSVRTELARCGFNAVEVSTASDLAFLAGSGCALVEARADA
jgi:SAM-dependent methyltransferase